MVFPPDYEGLDKNGAPLAGKAKGMEQLLSERGKLAELRAKHGNQLVAACKVCKMSQKAKDKAALEAKSRMDEVDGLGIEGRIEVEHNAGSDEPDPDDNSHLPRDCCMQRVLSLEPDFAGEKPLLQMLIEKMGHKCLFLPKFHCELNPIEMVWGQLKRRMS